MKLNPKVFLAQALASSAAVGVALAETQRPNFVFVLTDDQDVHMDSMDYMPEVQEHLVAKGATFDKHYCTVAICCPSRVNLWTGQMSHNTNVTNVQPPYGGYPKFIQNGYNDHHLALWLQDAGYNTYYGGKLFNGHTTSNYDDPFMSGYTDSAFFLEPWTYQYFNVSYTRNGSEPINPIGNYSTDLLSELSMEFIDHAVGEDKPFFLTVAPIAPHGFLHEYPSGSETGPPNPAKRHEELYEDYIIPRTDNFNPDEPSSVNWIANLEQMNDTVIEYNDEYQRLRMRSLASVDDLVGDLVRRLEDEDLMDNTFFIYSTDNGFHIGQHRLHPGKMCGLETDINVPMVIRGPGIEAGSLRSAPSSHTDLAPTLMQLAGEDITDKEFDGSPMDLGLPAEDYAAPDRTEHVAVEFWGIGLGESKYASDDGPQEYQNNTYKGLRIEAEDYGFYYSVWCNNVKELYDMKGDSGQLDNLLSPSRSEDSAEFTLNDQDVDAVASRLDALTMVLKSCKEDTCRDPWGALHPGGQVASLWDALHPDYDSFYEEQTKVEFAWCSRGHIIDAEGPQEYNVFGEGGEDDGEMKRFNVDHWSLWVSSSVKVAYYINRACDYEEGRQNCADAKLPIAPPAGLRMVVGDPSRRHYDASNVEDGAITHRCLEPEAETHELPGACGRMRAQTFFPSCWDGVNLDSPDRKSHMAFPAIGNREGGVCPKSHPYAIFSVFYEFFYNTGAIQPQAFNRWVWAHGDTFGYGLHGDYLQGWRSQEALARAIETCTGEDGVGNPNCSLTDQTVLEFRSLSNWRHRPPRRTFLSGPLDVLPGDNPVSFSSAKMK